ncbi:hypothetical protein J3F83DRAFT_743897 [Trichoderma novae-zelandiae]
MSFLSRDFVLPSNFSLPFLLLLLLLYQLPSISQSDANCERKRVLLASIRHPTLLKRPPHRSKIEHQTGGKATETLQDSHKRA